MLTVLYSRSNLYTRNLVVTGIRVYGSRTYKRTLVSKDYMYVIKYLRVWLSKYG